MDRRAFITLGVSVAMGGCLSGLGQPSTRIGWVRLVNDRSEPYETELVIEQGDNAVYRGEYRLGSTTDGSTVDIDAPVDGRRAYTISFLADGQWVHVYPEEYGDVDGECIGVRFTLQRQGTRGVDVEPVDECA